jgi:hypothetical protein
MKANDLFKSGQVRIYEARDLSAAGPPSLREKRMVRVEAVLVRLFLVVPALVGTGCAL